MPFTSDQIEAIRLISQRTFEERAESAIRRQLWIIRWILSPLFAIGLTGGLAALFVTVPDIAVSRIFARIGSVQSRIEHAIFLAETARTTSQDAVAAAISAKEKSTGAEEIGSEALAVAQAAQSIGLNELSAKIEALRTLTRQDPNAAALLAWVSAGRPFHGVAGLSDGYRTVNISTDKAIGQHGPNKVFAIDPSLAVPVQSHFGGIAIMTLSGTGQSSDGSKAIVSDGRVRFWLLNEQRRIIDPAKGILADQPGDSPTLSNALYYRSYFTDPGWQPITLSGSAVIPAGNYYVSAGYDAKESSMDFHALELEVVFIPFPADSPK